MAKLFGEKGTRVLERLALHDPRSKTSKKNAAGVQVGEEGKKAEIQ